MTKVATWAGLALFFVGSVALNSGAQVPARSSPPQAESPEAIKQSNQEKVTEIKKQIEGKENQPAETVFENIQLFKGAPAERVLMIMQSFSNALGVSCAHCHVPGEWEKEDKPQKQIARDMMKMIGTINNDLLKNIKNLKGPNPIVNCTTCHRGQLKPALNLEEPRPAK